MVREGLIMLKLSFIIFWWVDKFESHFLKSVCGNQRFESNSRAAIGGEKYFLFKTVHNQLKKNHPAVIKIVSRKQHKM